MAPPASSAKEYKHNTSDERHVHTVKITPPEHQIHNVPSDESQDPYSCVVQDEMRVLCQRRQRCSKNLVEIQMQLANHNTYFPLKRTVPIADISMKKLITTDFIRFGACLYAYSRPVIEENISEIAIKICRVDQLTHTNSVEFHIHSLESVPKR